MCFGGIFNDLSKCVCNGVSCVNVVLECVKCGSVSAPAFRVTQPICRLSGCSSVATVIGNDGQPELWLKLHRGWPRMTNVVRCVCVCLHACVALVRVRVCVSRVLLGLWTCREKRGRDKATAA